MTLSLITATVIYTFGTMVLINVLDPETFYASLTPVADAGRQFLNWVPYDLGVILIVVAAIAAFASTGNAGIMSASRYPYAMGKDNLVPKSLAKISKFGTPAIAILITVVAMMLVLVLFNVDSLAKLASAFQLLLFGLICIAVIVMREAKIPSYKPGFKAPLYPWLQILGILISFWLITEMGILAIAFTGMITIACILWYMFYTAGNLERRGAIFHVHERLGRQRYEGLEKELMTIIHERTQDENLSYEALIGRSVMLDFPERVIDKKKIEDVLIEQSTTRFNIDAEVILSIILNKQLVLQPISVDVQLAYLSHEAIEDPELFVFRFGQAVQIKYEKEIDAHTLIFLLTPLKPVGLDFRLAGHIAEVVQSDNFHTRWMNANTEREMNEVLMRDDHFLHGNLNDFPSIFKQSGKKIKNVLLPASCIIAIIDRDGDIIVASPEIQLLETDEIAIIGEPIDLGNLTKEVG